MIYEYYTDGACTLTKTSAGYDKGPGGWAFALVKDDKVQYSQALPLIHTTNNEAELSAIYRALLHYVTHFYSEETCDKVKIYSDSAYCINIYTQWIKNWEANGWRRGKKKEPIENLDIIKMTWELLKKLNEGFHSVEFIKVPGHAGNKFNEYVDKLAVEAKSSCGLRGMRAKTSVIDDIGPDRETVEKFLKN